MKITGYKVSWRVGEVGNLKDEEKSFLGDNPLVKRREAIAYAKTIGSVIYEGIQEGQLPFKTQYPITESDKQRVFPNVCALLADDNENIIPMEIYGEIMEILLDNLEEELECYDDNEYDTDGPTCFVNASKYNKGYVRLLKDDYDEYWDEYFSDPE